MIKRRILILCFFCLLFVAFTMSSVFADYVTVPAAAFHGERDTTSYDIITTNTHWYYTYYQHYVSMLNKSGTLVAPVYFPKSPATVLQMRVDLMDVTNVGSLIVRLIKVDHETGEWVVVFQINSGRAAAPGSVIKKDSGGKNRGVDNSRYAWFLEAEFKNPGDQWDLHLSTVRLEYQ